MIDVHAKPVSAEQDNWCELADLIRRNLLRLAMQANQTLENVTNALNLAIVAKNFHAECLAFDALVGRLRQLDPSEPEENREQQSPA